jgi:hypothetical protein
MSEPSYGLVNDWFAIKWATIKAWSYWLLHWNTRVQATTKWIEDRGTHPEYLFITLAGDEYAWKKITTCIAVVTGHPNTNDLKIVKCYYGEPPWQLDD